eukprot:m.351072 g.351072  ORF g.351072 m.351072 type:complete len:351 (+) comp16165_c0_seq2:129-1181(+)
MARVVALVVISVAFAAQLGAGQKPKDPSIQVSDSVVVVDAKGLQLHDGKGTPVDVRELAQGLASLKADYLSAISLLETKLSEAQEKIDELSMFKQQALDVLPKASRVVTLSLDAVSMAGRDLGDLLNEYFANGTEILSLDLWTSDPTVPFMWNVAVSQPAFTELNLFSSDSQHKHIRYTGEDGIIEDASRCPTVILMDDVHFVYPDRQPGQSYYNYIKYHRLIMDPHARTTIQGLTLREAMNGTESRPIYEHGLITVRGPFASIVVRDSRVEFGDSVFINAHSHGITHIAFGHVRFIGDGDGEDYPVIASKGQSWSGHLSYVSVSGGKLEGNATWAPEQPDKPFQMYYLT